MATTPNLGITHVIQQQNQPHVPINAGLDGLDIAIAGRASIDAAGSGNLTLTAAQQRNGTLEFTGTLTGARNIIVSTQKKWHIKNATTGAHALTVSRSSGTGVVVAQNTWVEVLNDGANVVQVGLGQAPTPSLLGLSDTPSSYTGHADKVLKVKVSEDGIEFAEESGGGGGGGATLFLDLLDAPAVPDYDGLVGQYLRVNAGETGFEFVTPPSPDAISMSLVVGDAVESEFAITHDFGSRNLFVMVRETASPYARLADSLYEVEFTDPNNILVRFDSVPTSGQYEVFIAIPWIGGETVTPGSGSAVYEVAGEYEFVVPSGVEVMTGKGWGAGGGGAYAGNSGVGRSGGGGGFSQCTFGVTPGETLTIKVGAPGAGFYYGVNLSTGAGGGGLTGVFRGSTPLMIAGSGGGAGICTSTNATSSGAGGAGGGTSGVGGTATGQPGGGPGTQSGGGIGGTSSGGTGGGSGGYLNGGAGGYSTADTYDGYGGAGGAGYFGGGGGGADSATTSISTDGSGGGGGSGYVTGTSTTLTAGSGAQPANAADADYGMLFAGLGGGGGAAGNPGRIVLSWGV